MDFSKIFLFKDIGNENCLKMMGCFDTVEKTYNKGEIIDKVFLLKNSVGILTDGEAIVIREDEEGSRVILEKLNENDVFAEIIQFLKISNDNVYVLCIKDCKCLFIPYEQITKRCSKACFHHTQLVENLFDLMYRKALSLSERVDILSRKGIRNKLMGYFSILAGKNEEKNKSGNINLYENAKIKIRIPCSMTSLAEYLCVDRSAMVRELGNMKKEGIIKMEKRDVEILKYMV